MHPMRVQIRLRPWFTVFALGACAPAPRPEAARPSRGFAISLAGVEEAWIVVGDINTSPFPSALAGAGDVDGDGHAELLVGARDVGENQGRAWLYRGDAGGVEASAGRVWEGENPYDELGHTLLGAGDLDADGYDDALLGADMEASGGSGYVNVHLGAPDGLAADPDGLIEGGIDLQGLGRALGAVGDVNDDGRADVTIGAQEYLEGPSLVFLHLGTDGGLAEEPDLTLTDARWLFGTNLSLASAGDSDGDGYDDLILGDWDSSKGRVSLYPGGEDGPDSEASSWIDGPSSDGCLGWSLARAGDVNGDGYGDAVAGDRCADDDAGLASVLLGSVDGLENEDEAVLIGEEEDGQLGYAVAGVGDLDLDGLDDLAIGEPNWSEETGRVHVLMGATDGDYAALEPIPGSAEEVNLGRELAALGDLNADAIPDLAVGAPDGGPGYATVYLGDGAGGLEETKVLEGTTSSALGSAVSDAGDLDGDGLGDVLVGEPGWGDDRGRVRIYLGEPGGLGEEPEAIVEGEEAQELGAPLAAAGDLNGDGLADLALGCDEREGGAGTLLVWYGAGGGLSEATVETLSGSSEGSRFGLTVSGGEDLDGDGLDDLVVGAPGAEGTGSEVVWVLAGRAEGLSTEGATTLSGMAGGDGFGEAVLSLGDADGDGYAEIAVGAPDHDGRGRVDLFRGGSTGVESSAAQTLFAGDDEIGRGRALGAEDVDGDGLQELLVGAEEAASERGRVLVFAGAPGGFSVTPSATLTGESAGDDFGAALDGVGDLNADGFGDLVVGSPSALADSGGVSVFLGSGAGLGATPLFAVEGDGRYAKLGHAVSSAGDTNGDGRDDVVLAAPYFELDSGRVSLILGFDPSALDTGEGGDSAETAETAAGSEILDSPQETGDPGEGDTLKGGLETAAGAETAGPKGGEGCACGASGRGAGAGAALLALLGAWARRPRGRLRAARR